MGGGTSALPNQWRRLEHIVVRRHHIVIKSTTTTTLLSTTHSRSQ